MSDERAYRQHLFILLGLFAVLWLILAIDPHNRRDWAMENILVLVVGAGMVMSHRWFRFSRVSITLIFLFVCLHELGAHYSYAKVPYDDWLRALFGQGLDETLGWERNQFDRLVHFCYGMLIAYPAREGLLRGTGARGWWSYFIAVDFILSTSAMYELIEWIGGDYFGGEEAEAYIAAQGDKWDSQKDMALAGIGALLALGICAAVNLRQGRDLALNWVRAQSGADGRDRSDGSRLLAR
ncbi:DUF2238 domain-containing protein [Pseudomonas indica]|uniref:Putative membrane protein n=1 Tax=Pseudomonas indica TaxID=137658 RepID=A0A1G9JJM8_9PSED|nr:DUF2238 domain-containing protein [Pseudomonas indica]SDL37492.1 putative membrane protein [Pseudomonas indica]